MAYTFPSSGKTKRTFNIERFRGVDFANSPFEVSTERSPDALNLIPCAGGWPEMRPGVRELLRFSGRINGIHTLHSGVKSNRLVHHGEKISLWRADGTVSEIYSGAKDNKSCAVQLKDKLVIFDGLAALLAAENEDGEVEIKLLSEAAYVPTTTIGRVAGEQMGGTALEEVNMIGNARRNTFRVNEEGQTILYMDSTPVKKFIKAEALAANGIWAEIDWDEEDLVNGCLEFAELPLTPVSGMDNIRVEFEVEQLGAADRQEEYTCEQAASVDEEGLRVWYWSSTDKALWAKKYWFRIGENLPREKVDVLITTQDKYYDQPNDDGKLQNNQYAATVSRGEVKPITLGYINNSLRSDEDEADMLSTMEVGLVQKGGVWYVTVIQPHTAVGGSYSGGRVYIRDIDSLIISWQESEKNLYLEKINGCTVATLFGVGGNADRIFASGNKAHSNMDWMSGFEDATYWPDMGYTKIGSEGSAVVGYSRLADGVLAIHKESAAGDSTVWYRRGSTNSAGEAVFTLTQGAVGVGAVSARCFAHFGTDNLMLSESGVHSVTYANMDLTGERYAQQKSRYINPKLCAEANLSEAVAVRFDGKYYLAVNDHVYVADIEAGGTYESRGGGYQYDWWYWEGVPVRVWYAEEESLMFGTADGAICVLDNECYDEVGGEKKEISCYWLTPVLDFGTRAYYKKIKNAYAVAEPYNRSAVRMAYILNGIETEVMNSRMSVFDFNDMDFDDWAFETDDMPRNLPSGTKAKKVMFMQIRLYNEPGRKFGLYGLTVLYTIGGKFKG